MKELRNFKNTGKKAGLDVNDPKFNEAMSKYGGMGEDQLIDQLLASVRTSRANGTYNPEQMKSYVAMLRPHISDKQYEKLSNIINIINSENV